MHYGFTLGTCVIMKWTLVFIVISISCSMGTTAQQRINYDENAIEPYELPKLLTLDNGRKIERVEDWEGQRRPWIIDVYKNEVYGRIPNIQLKPRNTKIIEQDKSALNGMATRKQIAIDYSIPGRNLTINVLLYLPNDQKIAPVFIGYNFSGNHSIINDREVVLTNSWISNDSDIGINANKATEESRGKMSKRWPVGKIISEGFGLATIYYGDVDPDRNDFSDGIHPFYYREDQEKPEANEWGSISAWAWGLMRVMDYLKIRRTPGEFQIHITGSFTAGQNFTVGRSA